MKNHPKIRRAAALIVLYSVLAASFVHAQTTRDLTRPANTSSPTSEARTALVIGNANYRNASPLANPVNDARDMSAALREVGFEVISGENLTAEQMKLKVTEFGQRLAQRKGVGLFFYAGHGVQINGRNYLIPVEAKALREQTIEFESLDVGRVLGEMDASGSRLNMVVLDACRNNPFERSWRSADQGLAEIRAPRGTLVAYATAPGKVAYDGTGRNGTFTSELLKLIKEPNILVETLFKRVGERVSAVSGGTQEPYLSQSIRGDFYFSVSEGQATVQASSPQQQSIIPVPLPTPMVSAPTLSAEEQYWQVVSSRNSITSYQQYLAEYPRGKYAGEANTRINGIKAEELRRQKEVELGRWNDARRANTKDSYNAYISSYPNGDYVAQARQGIRDLEIAEEKRVWDDAVILNRKSAFDSYLKAYPSGTYTAQAKAKIKEFERSEEVAKWNEADSLKTVAGYQEYLKLYPTGEFASLARLRLGDLGVKVAPASGAPGAVRTNSIGMELVYIPPGEFMMGSNSSDDEKPIRRVVFAEGFWMGKYEVTQGQWRSVMGNNPSHFSNCGADCPVEQVSWNDAKEFISRLNARNDGFIYSLPTEAQWEYAARAGTTTAFAFGDSLSSTQANFNGNYPYGNSPKGPYLQTTTKVGSYNPNAWGLYDMHGNVWEWVEDIWASSYQGLPTDGSANVTRGDSSRRVLRGGSWIDLGNLTRSAFRFRLAPAVRDTYSFGFRIVAIRASTSASSQLTANSSVTAANKPARAGAPKSSEIPDVGIVNGQAVKLVRPAYPAAARAVRASGTVEVQVTIDERGIVVEATAVSGHSLFRADAVKAARASTFTPTIKDGRPVAVRGVVLYSFVP
jgi:TonB family protein